MIKSIYFFIFFDGDFADGEYSDCVELKQSGQGVPCPASLVYTIDQISSSLPLLQA